MIKPKEVITAWVPVFIPRRMIDLYYPNDFEECLSSFIEDIDYSIKSLSSHFITVNACETSPPDNVKDNLLQLNSINDDHLEKFRILKIDCQFDPNPKTYPVMDQDGHTKILDDLGPFFACDLASNLNDIFLLASIGMPCRLITGVGRVFYNSNPFNEIDSLRGLSSEYLFERGQHWPSLTRIPLRKVINWERRLGLFASGIASTPLQRGLASLTHAIGNEASECGELLFWAMQGLESIYCSGKSELRGQLSEKSLILFGKWEDSKNIVGSLYDLRSKFVHGSHNIVRWNNELDLNSMDRKASEELYNATSLAIRLLLATIQKCIELDSIDLQFAYTLKS